MELVGFIILLAMLVLVGVGIGAGLFACTIAAGLAGLGVISSSVALGFYTKKPATAVRALLLQCGILAGIPAGAVCAWVADKVFHAFATWQGWTLLGAEWKIPLFGAIGGAFAGAILALMLDFILRRTHAWVEARAKRLTLPG
ncbi:MAG TPA: hypothetical protein VGE39_01020 [Prosthecobacter sp.]